jgi:hypothetical protein
MTFNTKSELSHQHIANNKVQFFDLCRLIPKGRKAFIHFTNDSKQNCKIELLNNKKQPIKTFYVPCSFNPSLGTGKYGTTCYGTVIYKEKIHYFFLEDVFFYKSTSVKTIPWLNKYVVLLNIIQDVTNKVFLPNTVVVNLPITRTDINTLLHEKNNIDYSVYCIEYLNGTKMYYKKIQSNVKEFRELVILPDVMSDIYHVYDTNYIGYACIPDLRTSTMMNKIFRKHREVDNIDLIEESEDEEEFELYGDTKYVDLNKSIIFKCKYNTMFQQWTPIETI